MQSSSHLKNLNVMFATPCYISNVSMNYTLSIFSLAGDAVRAGLKCSLCMDSDSLVPRCRNLIAKTFLECEEYTHLFFIDSDIQFKTHDVFRLLLAGKDVVAGTYPKKAFYWPDDGLPLTQKQFESQCIEFSYSTVGEPVIDEDGFMEVAELPSGFMCIERSVFTRMMKQYPSLKCTSDKPSDSHPDLYYRFFDCAVEPHTRRYLSEDYGFCLFWRAMGGKVYLDTQCNLGHLGQYLYKGDLSLKLTSTKNEPST